MTTDNSRNIGFLGPGFLGLGLMRDLPAGERESFSQWLVFQGRRHGEHYALSDHAAWSLHRAFARQAAINSKG